MLSRLWQAYDRAPRAFVLCDDHDVVGRDFVVSSTASRGCAVGRVPPSMPSIADAGRRVGFATVDALADSASRRPGGLRAGGPRAAGRVPRPAGRGLAEAVGAGRPRPRWTPTMDERGRTPRVDAAAVAAGDVLHNDFKLDNCQFAAGAPGSRDLGLRLGHGHARRPAGRLRHAAELLARSLRHPRRPAALRPRPGHAWACRREPRSSSATRRAPATDSRGVGWYEAFACWKTAVVCQQLYQRYVRGESTDERMVIRGGYVPWLAARACRLLTGRSS